MVDKPSRLQLKYNFFLKRVSNQDGLVDEAWNGSKLYIDISCSGL